MTRPPSKKANDFLQTDNKDIQSVFEKIRVLAELSERVTPFIPEELRDYCHVANLVNGQLILITANGSVATQLRFDTTNLLRKFKQDPSLSNIRSILCKVHPGLSTSAQRQRPPKAKPVAPLTPGTANIVKDMADSIEDPKLREVMKRIAGRVK